MSAHWQDHSIRRAIWWTRTFGRPLQAAFAVDVSQPPEDMRDLLERADKRLGGAPGRCRQD